MEKMSRQEKMLLAGALLLCAALIVYCAVKQTRAQSESARVKQQIIVQI